MAKAIHLKLEIGPKDPSNCDSFELAGELGSGPQKDEAFGRGGKKSPTLKTWQFLGIDRG